MKVNDQNLALLPQTFDGVTPYSLLGQQSLTCLGETSIILELLLVALLSLLFQWHPLQIR
jgi:hypothetical protein